jgi:hypothetical protein
MKPAFATALEYILVAALPLAAACGSTDAPGDDDATTSARIRVVHAGADAGGVDIHAEGNLTPLISDLRYGEVTDYLEVEPGTYNFQVRPTGRLDAPLFETGDITLEIGASITAIATGFVETDSADDAFRVLALKDAFADAGSGTARVRVVHAGADAPTVGIDVGNDDPTAPELDGLARFADTGADGVELPAGAALQVGITAGDATVTAFTTPALPDGAPLYVIASGELGESPRAETGFALMAVGPEGLVGVIRQNPFVYALHASPDAPAVDLGAGAGARLATNLSYGQLGRIQLPVGDATVDIYAAGGSTAVASAELTDLTAGESYLAVAAGFLAPAPEEGSFRVMVVQDQLVDADAGARAQIIHASPDAPAVDISTLAGAHLATPLLVESLRFGQLTEDAGLEIPAAALDLGIAQAGVPTPVATFGVTTTAGLRAFVVAAGALAPTAERRPFSLMVVNTTVQPWVVANVAPH